AIGRAPVQVTHGLGDGQQVFLADRLTNLPVVEVAATADGFFAFRFDVGRATHRIDQDLFNKAGAGTARAGSLGVFLHFIDAEQAVFLNRLDDGALAHTVAATHFGAVGH